MEDAGREREPPPGKQDYRRPKVINLLPEPKKLIELGGTTASFRRIILSGAGEEAAELARIRFRDRPDLAFAGEGGGEGCLTLELVPSLDGAGQEGNGLFLSQGYRLCVDSGGARLRYARRAGLINGLTSLKLLLREADAGYTLPCCEITDWPSLPVRAVAPTFSWYAGYGRIGFDSQLWGFDEWEEFLDACLDNKINQLNMVMYGYWPFEFEEYPETVLRGVPMKIWNAENRRWLTVRYAHPNVEAPFLERFIRLAHSMEVKVFAYVGLNSYNGAYSIKHPEARTKPPASGKFLNDFDSLCLSHAGTVGYILKSMEKIASLGFDGFTLEESEEGFWYCECAGCRERWHKHAASPVEAKHAANLWLLREIYSAVRRVNPEAVIGIRAFRQPPLEKDPEFLKACVDSLPPDIMLFWAPGLYVPETEFDKWCAAFGRERIWGRDTEANAITSTMGRLYRTFKSNVIRFEDEANEQIIENDIRQHLGSVGRGVHGINGFMFEWYGLFMHLFAHGNYGWGSRMDPETFFRRACELNFGALGEKVLRVIRDIVTIHESQVPLYTTPFPFQKNRMTDADIPAIEAAKAKHPLLMEQIGEIREACLNRPGLKRWLPHFDRILNAERRNAVIYDLALSALAYGREQDPARREEWLNEILRLNEADFDLVKELFFDVNPVTETGVKSCMYPYHEIKRLIHNIRHPETPDGGVICSGIEALGWLWL